MVDGLIDWASLTEVANSYRGGMRATYRWSALASVEVTCALVHGRHLKVSPGATQQPMSTRGPHDVLRAAITEYVDVRAPNEAVMARIKEDVDRWARGNVAELRTLVTSCLTNPDDVYGQRCGHQEWLATALGPNLTATGLRVGGLFDTAYLDVLSTVLGVETEVLSQVWDQSRTMTVIPESGELGDMVRQAHILSILLRGRYHDRVAQDLGIQVLHHPVRAPVLPQLPDDLSNRISHSITNSERLMSQLLWASGFSVARQDSRIRLWAENVRRVRLAILSEQIDLPECASDAEALAVAVDGAKRVGVDARMRLVEDGVDLLLAMGIGALSCFVVNGWPDLLVTLATYAASKKENFGTRLTRPAFENRRRLRELATAPGRIVPGFDT